MGAGEYRISTARAAVSPSLSPKASSQLIIPVPSRQTATTISPTSQLIKIAPTDGVQRIHIGFAYKRWRLHRSAYQSKVGSPSRTDREGTGQKGGFQENLKSKLQALVGPVSSRNPSPKPKSNQPQKLSYRLLNRKPATPFVLSTVSSRNHTPTGPRDTPKSAKPPHASTDLNTLLTRLRTNSSKPDLTQDYQRDTPEPQGKTSMMKPRTTVESLNEGQEAAISPTKAMMQRNVIARLQGKGIVTKSMMRRSSDCSPPPSPLIQEEVNPPLETRDLLVTETDQARQRRGSAS